MYAQEGLASRIGPVTRAVGIFVSAFVVLWAITPYLTAASTQAGPRASSGVVVTPVPEVPPTPTTAVETVTRIASGDADGFGPTGTWDGPSFDFVLPPGWPDTLEPTGDLTFSVTTYDTHSSGSLSDRSVVEWTIEVTNVSDERLWGLFVFMERAGRAECDHRILDPGETSFCTIDNLAYAGDQIADVWATAWNIEADMSADRILHPYTVAG